MKQVLSPAAKKATLAVANIVYDPKGIEQIKQTLSTTKNAKAIAPSVAMIAITLIHQLGNALNGIDDKEMWGKMGVVHLILGSIFEVAKHLGYSAPASDLEKAYKMVASHAEELKQPQGPQQPPQGPPQGAPPAGPMQGAMPPPNAAQQPPVAPQMGAQ